MEKPETKVCTKCRVEKPTSAFGAHKRGKNGLRPSCKECCRASWRSYKEENKEEIAARKRRRREENPTYYSQYRKENKEKIAAYGRRYREVLPEPYVKKMLGATPDAHIPQSLIEAKRFHLRIVRELRKD